MNTFESCCCFAPLVPASTSSCRHQFHPSSYGHSCPCRAIQLLVLATALSSAPSKPTQTAMAEVSCWCHQQAPCQQTARTTSSDRLGCCVHSSPSQVYASPAKRRKVLGAGPLCDAGEQLANSPAHLCSGACAYAVLTATCCCCCVDLQQTKQATASPASTLPAS